MDADDVDDQLEEIPDGAAVFPQIPDELGVHPLLLAVLHGSHRQRPFVYIARVPC